MIVANNANIVVLDFSGHKNLMVRLFKLQGLRPL